MLQRSKSPTQAKLRVIISVLTMRRLWKSHQTSLTLVPTRWILIHLYLPPNKKHLDTNNSNYGIPPNSTIKYTRKSANLNDSANATHHTITPCLEITLKDEHLTFQVKIKGHHVTLKLQDTAYLEKIIKEGINRGITELDQQI